MSSIGTVSVQQADGTTSGGGFVRGFACCPGSSSDPRASMATPDDMAQEPKPQFRLTTVQPGVAVEIEVGSFTRE
jgi:hypothetical protein